MAQQLVDDSIYAELSQQFSASEVASLTAAIANRVTVVFTPTRLVPGRILDQPGTGSRPCNGLHGTFNAVRVIRLFAAQNRSFISTL